MFQFLSFLMVLALLAALTLSVYVLVWARHNPARWRALRRAYRALRRDSLAQQQQRRVTAYQRRGTRARKRELRRLAKHRMAAAWT
jgi:hypothetical protein